VENKLSVLVEGHHELQLDPLKYDCLYCGCNVSVDEKDSFSRVRTDIFVDSALAVCAT